MEITKCEKVTREMVKSLGVGTFGLFALPNGAKIMSAKTTVNQVGYICGRRYSVLIYDEEGAPEYTIKITRLT